LRHREKIYIYKSRDVKTKYLSIYGQTRSKQFLGRTKKRAPYEIHRIWCRITLKMSEIRYVGVKCKIPILLSDTVKTVMKACILLKCTL
jgi:hypothetical protein